MSSKGQRVTGLTGEAPMVFRPYLAKAIGLNEAIVVERAHERQQATGQRHRVRHADGRDVELVCFRWPFDAQCGDFPFWSERTVRRVMSALVPDTDSTPNAGAAEPLGEGQSLLWRFSVRVAGRVSRDWYSVNYAAVGDSSQLFPAAAVDGPGWPEFAANLTAGGGQVGQAVRPTWPPVGGKGGEVQGPLISPSSNPAPERARLLSGGQAGRRLEGAVALLLQLRGAVEGDVRDVLSRLGEDEAVRRAVVMHSNVTRLEAAGLTFDKSPGVFALSGVRGNWHLLTDDEVRGRVEWQRAKRKSSAPARPVDFNQPTQAEQDRARAEHRRHREEEAAIDRMSDQQWAAVIDRARAQWPGRHPGRPFPADPRQAVFVRAIARSFLFGPATAGVPR